MPSFAEQGLIVEAPGPVGETRLVVFKVTKNKRPFSPSPTAVTANDVLPYQ